MAGWSLAIWFAVANLAAFWAFADDKARARQGHPRTPERSLLLLAVLGGSLGAMLAQQALRHKTRKQPFAMILWAICATQAAVAGWMFTR